ncbi:mediator of RNA polymerase II transcription subunit 26-like [Brevipalpus obovatus]|uniref:mediator of RNA polymerase II transcription subunit 26-like n=1 Tax=Brevipalpus obovatus TaxID=246614 RepID=UPI003D9DE932
MRSPSSSHSPNHSPSHSSSHPESLVGESVVEKIASEKWPGVNGLYDSECEWCNWEDMVTLANSYTEQVIHVLPYVNMDW